jgi:dihydrofolate synthase/folylpolyglutamate synthase
MNYSETIEYLLHALPMFQRIGGPAYKANLENAIFLDKKLNYPHTKYKTIHVGGTNGKGSVSHILASILQASGYKTGLYTSPHLLDFRERIKVNGKMVSKRFVIDFTEKNRTLFAQIKPSFFEMTAFMAFEYFAHTNVDVAIIEVGLGGRLDTTNIITPAVSVITNIGMDHTLFLGNSLEKIAEEKAGIIKKNIPVVIGETQESISAIFNNTAKKYNSEVYFADQNYSISYIMKNPDNSIRYKFTNCYHWNFENLDVDLIGKYQKSNIITSLMVLTILNENDLPLKIEGIRSGMRQISKLTGLIGRWQEIDYNPLVVCDIAHNTEGIQQILEQIKDTPHKKLHMLLGFVSDKDIDNILTILPLNARYYLCEPDIPRALKVTDLADKFEEKNLSNISFKNVKEAYKTARANAEVEDLIYVGGSTFVVADFLK